MACYPTTRMRRLRNNSTLRALLEENTLLIDDLVYPLFVHEESTLTMPLEAMPGVYRYSLDVFEEALDEIVAAGIKAVLLFGVPQNKDEQGSGAWSEEGIVQQALKRAKKRHPHLVLIADTCLCAYTSHGHCGVVKNGEILNDESVELLARVAVSQAQAGADIIAPSDMMDGRVGALRSALDAAGYDLVPLMSYAAKYASAFYGPFREAASSTPHFGNRSSYQINPANSAEALREIELDVAEGADIILIKPALAYGDVVYRASQHTLLPIAAYSVSGEYAMIKAAAARGFIDERQVVLESLLGLKRAGASLLITYSALDVARWL